MSTAKPRLPRDAKLADIARANLLRDTPRKLTPEQRKEQVHMSLNVQNPPDNSARLANEIEGQMELPVTEIDPYDKNPRTAPNERYAEIKESIRVAKVLSPLVVTRRPGNTRFMVGAGGNTRLQILRELWEETGDRKYQTLLVTYRPWESEAKTMTAHLVENELRAPMTFWDRANGVWALKAELEQLQGRSLSLRQLHEAMKVEGLSVPLGTLSYYGFALENLRDLGSNTSRLSKRAVSELQPVFQHLAAYFIAGHNQSAEAWSVLRSSVLKSVAKSYADDADDADESEEGGNRKREFDPARLIEALDQAVAVALEQSVEQVREIRQMAKTFPAAPIAELLLRYQNARENARALPKARPAPATNQGSPDDDNPPTPATGAESTSKIPGAVEPPSPPSPAVRTPALRVVDSVPAVSLSRNIETNPSTEATPIGTVEAITNFALECGFHDLLCLHGAMPVGYYVEIPADHAPLDMDEARPHRYAGWWLAAMHSGQIDCRHAHRLPAESLWRQAQLRENGHDEASLPWLIETDLGNPIGLVELGTWFTLCPPQVLACYHALLLAIRRLHATDPDRFQPDGGE